MIAKPLKEKTYANVVPFQKGVDRLKPLDLSSGNASLSEEIYNDINRFCDYINQTLKASGARYLVGGYGERRVIYSSSNLFDGAEPRRLHLGEDIWGPAGTPVFAVADGVVHSAAWNGAPGDYGGTVILQHHTGTLVWHTLYGHLSKASVEGKTPELPVMAGQLVGELGIPEENGFWPPHLHFQIILDMQGNVGDYPGVCRESEKAFYLENCPDPEDLLPWG